MLGLIEGLEDDDGVIVGDVERDGRGDFVWKELVLTDRELVLVVVSETV